MKHVVNSIHVNQPKGRIRALITEYAFVVGGLVLLADGRVSVHPRQMLDAYQQDRLLDAAERLWLLGRSVFPEEAWRLQDNGSWAVDVSVRPARTWAEREQSTALAEWT